MFSSVPRGKSWISPKLGHDCFRLDSFQFIIHTSSHYLTSCSLSTDRIVIPPQKRDGCVVRMEQAQDHVQWLTFVLAVLNLQVLLPYC
jgi:hypothetical protein